MAQHKIQFGNTVFDGGAVENYKVVNFKGYLPKYPVTQTQDFLVRGSIYVGEYQWAKNCALWCPSIYFDLRCDMILLRKQKKAPDLE